ncbi:hypothetical protein GLYMA_08G309551v4 [Glycine max]|nr:hypothetical protein GLYMA_08G309551v4 [Glycine max]
MRLFSCESCILTLLLATASSILSESFSSHQNPSLHHSFLPLFSVISLATFF